jgi:putative NADH-flavin reductase
MAMNVLVFGATGATGRQVVSQLLARGHRVTAFVRRPNAMTSAEGLRIVAGDTTGPAAAIEEALRGQDAVVSALGLGMNLRSGNLMTRSMQAILPALEKAGVRRLVVVSAFGVGRTSADAPLIPRIMHRLMLKDLFADKASAEAALRRTDLDWTIVYPVMLTNGPLSGKYRIGERLALSGVPKISRADVAHFIVGELEHPAHVRKEVILSI